MNESLISILGILIGIIATNSFSKFKTAYSFGFTGNTIIGVFGGVFFTKLVGRFGIHPTKIVTEGVFNYTILGLYLLISFLGGIIGLVVLKKILNILKFGKH